MTISFDTGGFATADTSFDLHDVAASASLSEPPFGRSFDRSTNRPVTTAFDFFTPGSRAPELLRQWHLTRLGDLATVWRDHTGAGVSVGVYDSSSQSAHWDLRYDASKHVTYNGKTFDGGQTFTDPAEIGRSGPHGTAVAGLIAARLNERGGVGVAHGASVTGVNIFDERSEIFINAPDPSAGFFAAMNQGNRFDVVNHSWGNPTNQMTVGDSRLATFQKGVADAAASIAGSGRGGLGTISVASAGNSGIDGQVDGSKSDRHIVAVGAYRQEDGVASNYSSHGAHLLVTGPSSDFRDLGGSGLTTTDQLGALGYNMISDPANPSDYTDDFGGTSGSAPIVSGVVALMIDANEGLGWRDVRNILAASAKMPLAFETGQVGYNLNVGGTVTRLRMNEGTFKLAGDEGQWNGGAMHFSTDYGYGAVDAYNAVRMSEVWSLFGPARTSTNEVSATTGTLAVGLTANSSVLLNTVTTFGLMGGMVGTGTKFAFRMDADVELEHVDLTINVGVSTAIFNGTTKLFDSITNMHNSQFKLTAPDGTEGFFSVQGQSANGPADQTYVLGFAGMRGVATEGEWTVEFNALDSLSGDLRFDPTLTLKNIKMDVYGAAPSNDDVHTYTGEFFAMAAIAGEGARRTLSDTNGGQDWINAAAMRQNVELSLVAGATTRFGTTDAFTIGQTTQIEHAVTGYGNDRLFGNALDNKLYGMRGNDWLNGGAGNDTLSGGAGADVFAFDTAAVSGNDRILDWGTGDRIASSKQLRGADRDGRLTIGTSALVLLDGTARGDTAELVGQGGAVLQAMGRSDGYWWYGFVSGANQDFVDGRVREMAGGLTPLDGDMGGAGGVTMPGLDAASATVGGTGATTMQDSAFFLYNTMGDSMAAGALTYA